MKKSEFRKLIREEIRKVLKENIQPGTKGYDQNDYPLMVVAGPFNSLNDLVKAIKTKYPKAKDILSDIDLMYDLRDADPADVNGFYLVKGSDYGGSGFSVVNGEDISVG